MIIKIGLCLNINKSSNELVKKGDTLFTLYSSKPIDNNLEKELLDSIEFSEKPYIIESVFAKLI